MAITSAYSQADNILTISISGRFDASYLDEFRKSYENMDFKTVKECHVDLGQTQHLDSSALGMLLVLRDFSGGDQSKIVIKNCAPDIKKIFTISSFEQLFTID